LISSRDALSHLPEIELDEKQAQETRRGIDLQAAPDSAERLTDGGSVRLCNRGELIAIGKFDRQHRIVHPAVVFTSE
jgi:tRNA U55 pseudouridine synthase TruB